MTRPPDDPVRTAGKPARGMGRVYMIDDYQHRREPMIEDA